MSAAIVDVVSAATRLHYTADRFWGRCPFCRNMPALRVTESASYDAICVDPERGTFFCFDCGVGGDAADFVAESTRLDAKKAEAVRAVSDRPRLRLIEGGVIA
jgi:DNA primase